MPQLNRDSLGAASETMLAEVIVMRATLFKALYKLAQGERLTGGKAAANRPRGPGQIRKAQKHLALAKGGSEMSREWGRNQYAGKWPNTQPDWTSR
jgi:hypothetical protein